MGGDASRPLAGAGRGSPDLLAVHGGARWGGTSMAALVPLGVARAHPRHHRGISATRDGVALDGCITPEEEGILLTIAYVPNQLLIIR